LNRLRCRKAGQQLPGGPRQVGLCSAGRDQHAGGNQPSPGRTSEIGRATSNEIVNNYFVEHSRDLWSFQNPARRWGFHPVASAFLPAKPDSAFGGFIDQPFGAQPLTLLSGRLPYNQNETSRNKSCLACE
jgi:hypothetical protein